MDEGGWDPQSPLGRSFGFCCHSESVCSNARVEKLSDINIGIQSGQHHSCAIIHGQSVKVEQWTTCTNQFSPSTLWVLGIGLGLRGLYQPNHLPGFLSFDLTIKMTCTQPPADTEGHGGHNCGVESGFRGLALSVVWAGESWGAVHSQQLESLDIVQKWLLQVTENENHSN